MKIKDAMTRMPYTVSPDVSIHEAGWMMREYRIRHIPVLDREELVGVISDRDIAEAESFGGPGQLAVGDAMCGAPLVVGPEEPLSRVLTDMINRKIGSVLVMSPRRILIGIFTSHDVLQMLRALVLLEEREKDREDEGVWDGEQSMAA